MHEEKVGGPRQHVTDLARGSEKFFLRSQRSLLGREKCRPKGQRQEMGTLSRGEDARVAGTPVRGRTEGWGMRRERKGGYPDGELCRLPVRGRALSGEPRKARGVFDGPFFERNVCHLMTWTGCWKASQRTRERFGVSHECVWDMARSREH